MDQKVLSGRGQTHGTNSATGCAEGVIAASVRELPAGRRPAPLRGGEERAGLTAASAGVQTAAGNSFVTNAPAVQSRTTSRKPG